jgi:hypothetical protein
MAPGAGLTLTLETKFEQVGRVPIDDIILQILKL